MKPALIQLSHALLWMSICVFWISQAVESGDTLALVLHSVMLVVWLLIGVYSARLALVEARRGPGDE